MVKPRPLLVLAVMLAGCRQPPRPPARGSADSEENQAILDKLQGYLDCLGEHSARVFQIADSYRARQGDTPAGSETPPLVEASRNPGKCIKAIRDARKQRPPLPELDAAADRFAAALQRVFTVTTAAQSDVDPAAKSGDRTRAIALQPDLSSAFRDFDAAQGALFDQVYRINRAVHLDQVARMEQRDGRSLAVRTEHMMLRAEDLVRFAATPWDHLDRLDVASFTAVLDGLEDAIGDSTSFAITHPKEADELGRFWAFMEDARAYLTAGKQLGRRVRQHIAYSDTEKIMFGVGNEAAVIGSPAALARAYNLVVEDFSHL